MTAERILNIARGEIGTKEQPEVPAKEIWKQIPDYEGKYEVSNLGRVRSIDRLVKGKYGNLAKIKGKEITPILTTHGYYRVNLCNESGIKAKFVHRLVASAFLDNPDGLPMINHKDEDKVNNVVDNLEWCDCLYNSNYGTRNQRVSESTRGKKKNYTDESHRKMIEPKEKAIVGINYITNEKVSFRSMTEAKKFGFSREGISHCITGRQKTHRGYVWRLI